jgi:hypothetical protein
MSNPVFIDGESAWLLTYNGNAISAEMIFTGIPADSYIRSVQYSKKNKLLFIEQNQRVLLLSIKTGCNQKKEMNPIQRTAIPYYSQVELPDGNILTNESDIIGDNVIDKSNYPLPVNLIFILLKPMRIHYGITRQIRNLVITACTGMIRSAVRQNRMIK